MVFDENRSIHDTVVALFGGECRCCHLQHNGRERYVLLAHQVTKDLGTFREETPRPIFPTQETTFVTERVFA